MEKSMNQKTQTVFIGDTPQNVSASEVMGETVTLLGENFYKISNYDAMPPFFMSIVSSSNHWIFISSSGGLSAGRISAENALFPYYTEDKLAENNENTGSKTICLVTRGQRTSLWEPFSPRHQGVYQLERNLYKNTTGTALVFEENNLSLGLSYRYAWRTSDRYGFVKTSWLANIGETSCQVEMLDGLQNILPANITSLTQNTFSPLLDAYKRSEVNPETGLAIYALNSTLTDLAEPSESLLATTVLQLGLDRASYLLSSLQLDRFRAGETPEPETEIRGRRGAYFVHADLSLEANTECRWHLVAEVNQDSAAIVHLAERLRKNRAELIQSLEADITANSTNLEKIVACADGLQTSEHQHHCAHHFANVMFNEMRGGIFDDQYQIQKTDFLEFVSARNRTTLQENAAFFASLPAYISLAELQNRAEASGNADLIRLSYTYLPLTFSRRHGDPSRPWNRFAINIKKEDGSKQLDYEGNWRDIFQNWEALAFSYPEYVESMICTFLNATTVDGYNPYRITRQGIDWEIPEPNNPWANIGYWSDHQLIYLQKLMEVSSNIHPGKLQAFLNRPIFSYANVPYRIKPYADLLKDPYNSISFDWEIERAAEMRVKQYGSDGKLLLSSQGQLLHGTLAEKLLTLLLAKLVNFVPEGGIWMNTQRPEWNDANNALVGKGLSVVTLAYLRRSLVYFKDLITQSGLNDLILSQELKNLYHQLHQALQQFQNILTGAFNDVQRRAMMDALGQAGSDYRWNLYQHGPSGEMSSLPVSEINAFLELALRYVEHSLRANKRSDHLYHSYNVLHLGEQTATVNTLYEMLEGQVAMLSSGLLNGAESLDLLESLRRSQLYRADQHTYILYPDRELPGFLEKNSLTPDQVQDLALFPALVKAQDKSLITQDELGNYHFNGRIRNLKDVSRVLRQLEHQPELAALAKAETARIEALFEKIFRHSEFTGRSGTFFAYEGLGSIYWHMISKLMLAVQETVIRTRQEPSTPALLARYADIRAGQCFNKSPALYGAFPSDPYSHTPKNQGARQPGMTGMVKEEILARQMELGWCIQNGRLVFDFMLFNQHELLEHKTRFVYWSTNGQQEELSLPAGSLAYTICQIPVILQAAQANQIQVFYSSGDSSIVEGLVLDETNSQHIFQRDGKIHHLVVSFIPNH
jgi:hypothetical protein